MLCSSKAKYHETHYINTQTVTKIVATPSPSKHNHAIETRHDQAVRPYISADSPLAMGQNPPKRIYIFCEKENKQPSFVYMSIGFGMPNHKPKATSRLFLGDENGQPLRPLRYAGLAGFLVFTTEH